MADKTRQAVNDALNGDIEKVDPAVRRALFALCTISDEHALSLVEDHREIMKVLGKRMDAQDKRIGSLQRLLVSTTVTFVVALATGLLNLLIN